MDELDYKNKHIEKKEGKCGSGFCFYCGPMPYVGYHFRSGWWLCLGCMDEYEDAVTREYIDEEIEKLFE